MGTKESKASKARDKCRHDRRKASRAESDTTGAQQDIHCWEQDTASEGQPETFKAQIKGIFTALI